MICLSIQTNVSVISLYLCFSNILGTFSSVFMKDHQDKLSPRFLDVRRHVLFGLCREVGLNSEVIAQQGTDLVLE